MKVKIGLDKMEDEQWKQELKSATKILKMNKDEIKMFLVGKFKDYVEANKDERFLEKLASINPVYKYFSKDETFQMAFLKKSKESIFSEYRVGLGHANQLGISTKFYVKNLEVLSN